MSDHIEAALAREVAADLRLAAGDLERLAGLLDNAAGGRLEVAGSAARSRTLSAMRAARSAAFDILGHLDDLQAAVSRDGGALCRDTSGRIE